MLLPALGLLIVLFAWFVPSAKLPPAVGWGLFFAGWIVWAFTMPLLTQERVVYFKQVAFFLVFFPVMYPFILALVPWGMTLASRTAELERKLADGAIKLEIPGHVAEERRDATDRSASSDDPIRDA